MFISIIAKRQLDGRRIRRESVIQTIVGKRFIFQGQDFCCSNTPRDKRMLFNFFLFEMLIFRSQGHRINMQSFFQKNDVYSPSKQIVFFLHNCEYYDSIFAFLFMIIFSVERFSYTVTLIYFVISFHDMYILSFFRFMIPIIQ